MPPSFKKAVNPNPLLYPGPGDIDALTESKTFEFTSLNVTFGDDFTMPEGYSRIIRMIFDPGVGAFISLTSQRAKQDIVSEFNTLGVNNGVLELGTKDLNDDVIKYRVTLFSQGIITAAVWNGVSREDVPANPLPYKHTLTLVYGR